MSALSKALLAAQAKLPHAPKGAENPHFRSKYVTLDTLIDVVRPVLNAHGLVLMQAPTMQDGEPMLCSRLIHADSGEAIEYTMPLVLDKQSMQGLGSAITYARRYALSSMLGVASEEDDDGNRAPPRQGRKAAEVAPEAAAQDDRERHTARPSEQGDVAGDPGHFTFPTGKHQGKPLRDVPADYLDWYLANGPRTDVKEAIARYRVGEVPF